MHGKLYWLASDWATAIQRSVRHTFRSVDALLTGLALPIVILLLFVTVFSGAVSTGTDYVNYIIPGVILTCVVQATSTTAMIVNNDMTGGLFNRFRTLPMARSAVLVGHIVGSVLRNGASAALVFVAALAVGFRPNADFFEWLAVAGLLILAMLALSWLSAIFGMLVKSIEVAASASFVILFLPYVSSAFVPAETLPTWIRGFAEHQPMTPLIDALRSLLIGTPMGNSLQLSLIWFGSITVVSTIAALIIYRAKGRR